MLLFCRGGQFEVVSVSRVECEVIIRRYGNRLPVNYIVYVAAFLEKYMRVDPNNWLKAVALTNEDFAGTPLLRVSSRIMN